MIEKEKSTDWKLIDRHFKESDLYCDCINAWSNYHLAKLTNNTDKLKPIKNYDEYLHDKASKMNDQYPNFFEYIQKKTNKNNKNEYDSIVKQYNNELEEIKNNSNWDRAKRLYNMAYKIIYGHEPKINRTLTNN